MQICAHLVAFSNLIGLNLFDKRYYKEIAQQFELSNKRGPKRKTIRRKLAEKALFRD